MNKNLRNDRKAILTKLFSGAYFGLISNIFFSISSIIWIPYALKIIGEIDYSKIVILSLFYVKGFSSILLVGYPSTILKFGADFWSLNRNQFSEFYKYVCSDVLKISAIPIILLLFISFFVTPIINVDLLPFILVIISIPFQLIHEININFLNSISRFRLVQRINLVSEILKVLLIFYLLKIYSNYESIIFSFIISFITAFLISSILLIKKTKIKNFKDKAEIYNLNIIKNFNKNIFTQNIYSTLLNSSDKILTASFFTPYLITLTDIITKLTSLINRVLMLTLNGVIPVIGPLKLDLSKYFNFGQKIFTLLCLFSSSFLFFFSESFLQIWLSDKYDPKYFEVLRTFSMWPLLIALQYPGIFYTAKNISLNKLTKFRFWQVGFKFISFPIAFLYLNEFALPVAYFISLLPVIILIKALPTLGVNSKIFMKNYIHQLFLSILFIFPYIILGSNFISFTLSILILIMMSVNLTKNFIKNG